ncbi:MAG: HPr family phosphocarrier protein [Clostridia bacterium]|nr:HPr family phosphocarrier protein [Clostridia bacterium]
MSESKVSKIKLNEAKEVEEFVTAAGKCDFDIDIFYNRVIIDAKSILGILSMDPTKELTVQCYGENKEFNHTLKKFATA